MRRTPHFALHDDHQFVAKIEILCAVRCVGDACEQFGDEFHLVDIVVCVAVELSKRQIG